MYTCLCMCTCAHTQTHRQTHGHTGCCSYLYPWPQCASPRLIWGLILTPSSQSGFGKAVKLLCAVFHPPPSVLCLPPKSSEITGSACGDAESNLGLIFGSACDSASFTSCPVVVSVSTHTHPPPHTHRAPPAKSCALSAEPAQSRSVLLHFRLFLLRQQSPK